MKCRTTLGLARTFAPSCSLPFLILLSASTAIAQDSFANDARLSARHTIKVLSRPLSTALPEIGKQCGISLSLDPNAPDERIFLLAHDRPLKDTLRAISSFCKLEWKRAEKGGSAGWVLIQTPEARAAFENDFAVETKRVVDQIVSEAAIVRQYSEMGDNQLRQRLDVLAVEIKNEKDVVRRWKLEREKSLGSSRLYQLGVVAAKLIDSVGEQPIRDALQGKSTEYVLPARRGMKTIPLAVDTAISDYFNGKPQKGNVKEFDTYSLMISQARYSREVLVQLTISNPGSSQTASFTTDANSPYDSVQSGATNLRSDYRLWKDVAYLNRQAFLSVPVAVPANLTSGSSRVLSSLAESLMQLDSLAPADIISDAFITDTCRSRYEADNIPLGEALNRLSEGYGRRWSYADGFISLRSIHHDSEQRWNPPAGLVDQLLAKLDHQNLDLEDVVKLSALPMHQLKAVESIVWNFRSILFTPSTSYLLLNEIRRLTPEQRLTSEGDGLPLTLLPEQQQLSLISAFRDFGLGHVETQNAEKQLNADAQINTRLKVARSEKTTWGYRKNARGMPETYRTKDEAIQALQNRNISVKAEELSPCTICTVTLKIEGGPQERYRRIELPAKWVDEAK